MKTRTKARALALSLGALALSGCAAPSPLLERVAANHYLPPDQPVRCASQADCDAAGALYIADLHADTLLWTRELSSRLPERRGHGHVSLDLLRLGKVDLQVFSAPTRTPLHARYTDPATGRPGICIPAGGFDLQLPLRLFGGAARYPRAVLSTRARAERQAERLKDWIAEDGSNMRLVRGAEDLEAAREAGELAALFALEGMHWIHGEDEEQVRREVAEMAALGVRMASLTHRFANGLAVGSEDCGFLRDPQRRDAGLSAAGRAALAEMMAQGMIVDVAHASDRSIRQIAAMVRERAAEGGRPPGMVHSHGGVQAVCPLPRNLSDASIREIVGAGGVVGIGYWPDALCTQEHTFEAVTLRFAASLLAVVDAVSDPAFLAARAAAGLGPPDPFAHLALGSDFDGSVTLGFDAAGAPALLAALGRMSCEALDGTAPELAKLCAAKGILPLSPGRIEALAGGNVRRVLAASLPR